MTRIYLTVAALAVVIAGAFWQGARWEGNRRDAAAARAALTEAREQTERRAAIHAAELSRLTAEKGMTYDLGQAIEAGRDLDGSATVFGADRVRRLYRRRD